MRKRGSSTPRGGKPGRGRGGQRGGRRNRDLLEERTQEHGPGFKGFSMADEARQTFQHPSHWDIGGTLRSKPISFVSAGPIEPLKELEQNLTQCTAKNVDSKLDQPQPSPLLLRPAEIPGAMFPNDETHEALHNTVGGGEYWDDDADDSSSVIGPEELEQDIVRATRSDKESSAHESPAQFFFDLKGDRREGSAPRATIPVHSLSPKSESSSGDEIILFKGRDATPIRRAPESTSAVESTTMTLAQMDTEIRAVEADLFVQGNTRRGRSKKTKGVSKEKRPRPGDRHRQTQDSEDDDAAVIADYLANMRENGEMSDLLGTQPSDARNTRDLGGSDNEMYDHEPEKSEPSSRAMRKLKQVAKNDSYESGSELDDTTLSKLLQGHVPGTAEDVALEGFVSSNSESSDSGDGPAYDQENHQGLDHDEFDLMDWSRPSLRKKKGKASRALVTFDVSDDDFQKTLQMAWKNDRLKKSTRKKEREELRALGMLGRHASRPDDLRTKYPAGMDIEQVGEEIKGFLKGGAETMALPPMDTHARKIVHEIASKFKIKSKSTGKADQRRTSLFRTKRTLQYSEGSFDQAVARVHRRFLPRLDVKGKRGSKAPPLRTNHAAASYREGEVVGGAAPELGSENRGRAMLEKMGWSTGTALGAMDNKGILQPVPQTMKKSKAGLG